MSWRAREAFQRKQCPTRLLKDKEMAPVGGWYQECQPHTTGVQKSGVMEERMRPVAQRTKAPSIRPVPC